MARLGALASGLLSSDVATAAARRVASPAPEESVLAVVLLIRHAVTAATGKRLGGWTPGVHLSEEGRAQAQRVADRLSGTELAAVYASPLERTQETARIIAWPHGLRVRTRKGIGEVDYGEWTDKPLGQLRRRTYWKVIQQTPSRVTFPGGESIRGAQARAVETVETIAAAHDAKEVVALVSHADVIKAAVAHFVGMPLDLFQRLVVSPASVTTLALGEDSAPMLLGCNDTGPVEART